MTGKNGRCNGSGQTLKPEDTWVWPFPVPPEKWPNTQQGSKWYLRVSGHFGLDLKTGDRGVCMCLLISLHLPGSRWIYPT